MMVYTEKSKMTVIPNNTKTIKFKLPCGCVVSIILLVMFASYGFITFIGKFIF